MMHAPPGRPTRAYSALGSFVRERREQLGWTQTRLGEDVGTSRAYISQIESGKTALPSPDLRRRLAAALGVRHVDLLIAAGELDPLEVPHASDVPAPGSLLVAKIDRLPVAVRLALETQVDHMLGLADRGVEAADPAARR